MLGVIEGRQLAPVLFIRRTRTPILQQAYCGQSGHAYGRSFCVALTACYGKTLWVLEQNARQKGIPGQSEEISLDKKTFVRWIFFDLWYYPFLSNGISLLQKSRNLDFLGSSLGRNNPVIAV
jgi:hypothetical protein